MPEAAARKVYVIVELGQAISMAVPGWHVQPPAAFYLGYGCTADLAGKEFNFHPINYTCIMGLHGGLHGYHLVRTFLFSPG